MNWLKQQIIRVALSDSMSHMVRAISGDYVRGLPGRGFRQLVFDIRDDLIQDEIVARLFWGMYESEERRQIARHLPRHLDIVELGSSIGVITCYIRSILTPEKRLIAVEGRPDLLPIIEKNLKLNELFFNTQILNYAIDYSGALQVSMAGTASNTGGHITHAAEGGFTVPTKTLTDILHENDLQAYALVCDIEGAEASLIFSDTEALANCQQIIIELHRTEMKNTLYTPDQMTQHLLDFHGFSLVYRQHQVGVFQREKR